MNDIITRLRALADLHYPAKLTVVLREAADRIQTLEWHLNDRTEGAQHIAAERDALKKRPTWAEWEALKAAHEQSWQEQEARRTAKLAEAEKARDLWVDRAHSEYNRADAACGEAAALRELLDRLATLDCGDNSCRFAEARTGMRTNGGCRCLSDSMPRGPYQQFHGVKKLARDALSQPGAGAALLERLRRAEALIRVVFTPGTVTEEHQRVYDEWAALEEKP